MAEIIVAKPFTLSLTHGDVRYFPIGIHKDVSTDVADHWFTKEHLAKDGKVPEPDQATPLNHEEERRAFKASLDEAANRVLNATVDAQSARDERDKLKSDFGQLVAENTDLKSRIAGLEATLDKATKPADPPVSKK